VRELENLLLRLAAIEIDDTISAATIERELATTEKAGSGPAISDAAEDIQEYFENYLSGYFANFGQSLPPSGLYERFLAEFEPPLLRAALAATAGNQLKASALLGINRNTLRSKLRERNVKPAKGIN
jgi:two-component system nitrogen regulation response regulator GlnG